MNYLGHCAVAAAWLTQRSHAAPERVAFGSMLPDFVTILDGRVRPPSCEATAVGVALHHATDELFHQGQFFQHHRRIAGSYLDRAGVPRGPSRAVAHVGVELILDAHLQRRKSVSDWYRGALQAGRELLLDSSLSPAEAAAWTSLLSALGASNSPAPCTASGVTDRLFRILQGRPRLQLDVRHHSAVLDWTLATWERVGRDSAAWLGQLVSELAEWSPASGVDPGPEPD